MTRSTPTGRSPVRPATGPGPAVVTLTGLAPAVVMLTGPGPAVVTLGRDRLCACLPAVRSDGEDL
jgi:hypothetical protein